MTALTWDNVGERFFETGVDHGALYIPTAQGIYDNGVAWNGLVNVTESPSGAEASPQYADNIKYLNLYSAEEFGATIEAFTYPKEFMQFDGIGTPTPGVYVGQQNRKPFGLSYRTKVGNDLVGADFAYKLHLVYGAMASPSERAYGTVNDSPEAMTMSWELTTSPVAVPGLKPSAILTIDSRDVAPAKLADLETILYGAPGVNPRLPLPTEVISIFAAGVIASGIPVAPTYSAATDLITIPTVTGVEYFIDGVKRTNGSTVLITESKVVKAYPAAGYKFPANVDDDWLITFS
ncbi:major tail protein [Arthrobacter phage Sporto]|nr:major tail protein [Arthrobacter phage Sporto]